MSARSEGGWFHRVGLLFLTLVGAGALTAAAGSLPMSGPSPSPGPTLSRIWQPDGHDYLLPAQSKRRLPAAPKTGLCFECSREVVAYTSFQGEALTLVRYTGRHLSLLVPEVWPDSEGFTDVELRLLLDRSDLLYEHFRDLMQGEPLGEGPLQMAFVPGTCGFGCGYVGAKGIEIANDRGAVEAVKRELGRGLLHDVVVHEMAHNFDLYSAQLHYLPDAAHAWTDFINFHIYTYSRLPRFDVAPDEVLHDAIERFWSPYFNRPDADWPLCVRDGQCEGISRNGAWAGVSLLTALHYGPGAIKQSMRFLAERPSPPPEDAAGKEDLRIAAHAAGAGLNFACHVDTWRWQASTPLRADMAARYGQPVVLCDDADQDGFSPLDGDCDDHQPTAFPGNPEIQDGLDNNCDRLVDNLLVVEPEGDFPPSQRVTLPSAIQGRIDEGDGDAFVFSLDAPADIRVKLCSARDFRGWLFVFKDDGGWLDYQYVGAAGACETRSYRLDAARDWRFEVALNVSSAPGEYTVSIWKLDTRPGPSVEVAAACESSNGEFILQAETENLPEHLATSPTTEVRFWVSGFGFVGSAPATESHVDWRPASALVDGDYFYRAQLYSNGNPVSDASAPQRLILLQSARRQAVERLRSRHGSGDGTSTPSTKNQLPRRLPVICAGRAVG